MSHKDRDLGLGADDVLLIVLVGVGAVSLGILNPGGMLDSLGRWLVEHKLLVPSQEAVIPLLPGLGLGGAQLGVIVGILIAGASLLALLRRSKQQSERDGLKR